MSPDASWYKRYTGTVGGEPIVLNLHHYGMATVGEYYYVLKNELIDLTDADVDAPGNKNKIILNEYVRTNNIQHYYDSSDNPDRWEVTIDSNAIRGNHINGNNGQQEAIVLKEDYGDGSCRLDIILHEDSVREKKGITHTMAVSAYQLLAPAANTASDNAAYLQQTFLHILGADSLGATDIRSYIEKEDQKYFDNYKRVLADMPIDRQQKEAWEYNFFHSHNMWVLYNRDSMLVLQTQQYDYSGGGSSRGNFWSSYTCIDVQQKKIWQLDDMLRASDTSLIHMLNEEARNAFKLHPADVATNRYAADSIHTTRNVFISSSGITFCYNPGEVGAQADGALCIFLSYDKLRTLLKDEFRTRMKL